MLLPIFSVLFIALFTFEIILSYLNNSYIKRTSHNFPTYLVGYSTPHEFSKSASYSMSKGLLEIFSTILTTGLFFLLLVFGVLGKYEQFLSTFIKSDYLLALTFLGSISLLSFVISISFSLYKEFKIEKRYGFSNYTFSLYFLDLIKKIFLGLIISIVLFSLVYFFLLYTNSFWWLWAFIAMTLFSLLVSTIFPVFIAPLFNKFTPLEDGELKNSLSDIANKLNFSMKGIYVMDGSRRSGHQNAYFSGFGKMRRIVLYDTLISSLTISELTSVVAHEMGHWKKRHIISHLIVSIITNFFIFWGLGMIMKWDSFFGEFSFSKPSIQALLVLLIFCFEPILAFLRPFMNILSRRHEFQADRFSVELLGDAQPMMSALLNLSRDNLSLSIPHKLYSFWNYSHPALQERLKALFEISKVVEKK